MDFTSIIIFIIVLFLYLHITSQWKRSEDLEIYEMDYETNAQLQEVCDVKQPVLFEFKSVCPAFFNSMRVSQFLETDQNQDVNVKDTHDYVTQTSVDYIVLPFKTAYSLLKTDPAGHLISEGNHDFIEEGSHTKRFQTELGPHLKPSMTVRSQYDVCMGSAKSHTPLRYHTHSRHYCIVTEGTIHVKMAPWKSGKYLHPIKDYENLEFFSNMDPWKSISSTSDKIKFLEFEVMEGYVLCVPPYWWYSIQYDSHESIVCTATYNSTMNLVANAKHWILYFFQQQNIQQKTMKTIDMHHGNEDTEPTHETHEMANGDSDNIHSDADIPRDEDPLKNLRRIGEPDANLE